MSLRELLAGADLLVAPGVSSAYAAQLTSHLGFKAVYLGGNALGLELGKGQPFLEARDVVEAAARIRAAAGVPIVADAGAGFGDAIHVRRAVRDLEAAGVAALHIDDQVHPKRAHYHRGRTQLAPVDVVAGKLLEAVKARRSDDLMIVARTDALRATQSLDATLVRLRAYAESGVDGLLLLGGGLDEVAVLKAEFPDLAHFWIATLHGPLPSVEELATAGYDVALYPFHGVGAMTEALLEVWSELARSGRPGKTRRAPKELIDLSLELVDIPAAWEIEERTVLAGGGD